MSTGDDKSTSSAVPLVGSYQQTAVPMVESGDEAYAQRLQDEEFIRAQGVPHATVHPVQTSDGTQYVAMYPPPPPPPRDFNPAAFGVAGGAFIAPHEQRLINAYSLGRLMRILSVLDGVILFLNSIYFPILFFILLWAPLSGWLAGSRYSVGWTYAYACYYIIRLSIDFSFILSGYLIFILVFIVNIIIARYIMRFAKVVNSLSPAEVEQLRSPTAVWSSEPQPFVVL